MQIEAFGVLVVVLVIFAFLFLKAGIKIVSQADNLLIERLGKFHKVLDGGFHIIIPFVDQIRAIITIKEQLVDIKNSKSSQKIMLILASMASSF